MKGFSEGISHSFITENEDRKGWLDINCFDCSWYESNDDPASLEYGWKYSNVKMNLITNGACCYSYDDLIPSESTTASLVASEIQSISLSPSHTCFDSKDWKT